MVFQYYCSDASILGLWSFLISTPCSLTSCTMQAAYCINTGAMRAESVVRLALAAGRWFADKTADDGRMTRPMVVIGKDTRLSGYMLESALVAGFTSIGINCRLLGPVPTAAVSYLTHSLRADFGVMISASHNPHHDNGIKLFGPDGYTLDDAIEEDISALMRGSIALAPPDGLGRARRIVNSDQRYMEFAKATCCLKCLLN